MALTKTKTDLVGTPASMTTVTTGQVWKGTTSATNFVRRDVSGKAGVAFTFKITYTGATVTVRPKLEIFTAVDDTDGGQDTVPYETVEIGVLGTTVTGTYQATVGLRFAEDLMFVGYQITAPTFSAGSVTAYLGVVETTL